MIQKKAHRTCVHDAFVLCAFISYASESLLGFHPEVDLLLGFINDHLNAGLFEHL